MKKLFTIILALISISICAQTGGRNYLREVKQELNKTWPDNKTINLVFHGHSVPSGYFNTPIVRTLQSYPYLTLATIKEYYPNAVVNVITTSIGGENSLQGNDRFEKEVLNHRPDVLFIDYALNDRGIGLIEAKKAWTNMIQEAMNRGVKVVLLTPTPDMAEDITDDRSLLEQHSRQIRELAGAYKVGLVDSYAAFKEKGKNGENLKSYMSQSNHPNEKGHAVVKDLIIQCFFDETELITE